MASKPGSSSSSSPGVTNSDSGGGGAFMPKLLSFFGLWVVSTMCGASIRASLSHGTYHYSPATTFVLSELFKALASLAILVSSAAAEEAAGRQRQQAETETGEDPNITTKANGNGNGNTTGKAARIVDLLVERARETTNRRLLLHLFGLALLYAVQNNASFPMFRLVDAASAFLLKAATTVITALVSFFVLGRPLAHVQWLAVFLQFWGLVVTQYDQCHGKANFGPTAYLWLLLSVALSTVAGFWNEFAIKRMPAALALQNLYLYLCGFALNLLAYNLLPADLYGVEPQGFFDGWTWQVWVIVVANSILGLVITAVYKYADVLIKTVAMASATVTLGLLEFLWISGKRPGVNEFIGAVVVFSSVYAYMSTAKKVSEAAAASTPSPAAPAVDPEPGTHQGQGAGVQAARGALNALLTPEGIVCLACGVVLLTFQGTRRATACHH